MAQEYNNLILIEEREKALCVADEDGNREWIPRSAIDYLFRHPSTDPNEPNYINIQVAEWKAKELNLLQS